MNKHYDYKTSEKAAQDLWSDLEIYKFKDNSLAPVFSIDTPPPTVSGALHIGHIFSYTQAEIIARYKRMKGFNVFYPFGFDDNGLPTERLVEREHTIRADSMSREEFTKLCLDTTGKYESEFKHLWQAMGLSCDWNLQYETISPTTQRLAQQSFIELYHKGLCYRKEAPVLWCPHCQTSIAQADLEHREKDTTFITLSFIADDGTAVKIATTRPEMLYGCVALFLNPSDPRLTSLLGQKAQVPLYGHHVPILADDLCALDKGTGAAMCCTYGDQTDLLWTQKYNLPYRETIEPQGTLIKSIPHIGGLSIKKGRTTIIELLHTNGLISDENIVSHSYTVHERCGLTTEILPSPQWYIDLLNHKEKFLELGHQIQWYPQHMKSRYTHWVENLKYDWCISRQRYFGVPFPVWYCKCCGEVHVAPLDANLPINPLIVQPLDSCSCGSTLFEPEKGVMDTWMTSSITPQINSRCPEHPMSMRAQAHEIIRTWAFYSIVKSWFHTGDIPWKTIMISGFVLAKRGEKISKSKENSILSPLALIEGHSADALRYWTAGSKLGTDTFFDISELSIAKRLMTKLWNAGKFIFTQLSHYNPELSMAIEGDLTSLLPIDQWLILESEKMLTTMSALLDEYEIGSARQVCDDFFWKTLCDDYLELVKARLYQPENFGDAATRSGQQALYIVFLNVLKGYGIYIPHLTEHLYQLYYRDKEASLSLHATLWPQNTQDLSPELSALGCAVQNALKEARHYKAEHNLSMKSSIPAMKLHRLGASMSHLTQTLPDLLSATHAEGISFTP